MFEWLFVFKWWYLGIVFDVVFENCVEDLMCDEVDIVICVMFELL